MYAEAMQIKAEGASIAWGPERRLEFIDFRLRWEGRLNRKDLIEHFGVSTPQASLDIAKYMEQAPDNMEYDASTRCYLVRPGFRPLSEMSAASRFLAELLATKSGLLDARASMIGDGVECDFAPAPRRSIDDEIVVAIVRAIKLRRTISVKYYSMSSSNLERQVSPLALGHDGFRWHVRAFCHMRNRFSDFVLTRLGSVRDSGASSVSITEDVEWNTLVYLVITPHPDLTDEKRAAIAYDYGMVDGEVRLPCRQALLFYTLKHLGLADQNIPNAAQIFLKNKDEVQPYLDAILHGV